MPKKKIIQISINQEEAGILVDSLFLRSEDLKSLEEESPEFFKLAKKLIKATK